MSPGRKWFHCSELKLLPDCWRGRKFGTLRFRCEERVANGEPSWDQTGDILLSVLEHKLKYGDVAGVSEAVAEDIKSVVFRDLTPHNVEEIYRRFDSAKLANLLKASPNDYIEFEYRDRDVYISFQKASPGQQAAALLKLLLNQEAGTLIIDQPEDDLDNRVIMTIAKLLQITKQKRQLIFATHNPNLVVNGDADKIVALMPVADMETGIAMAPQVAINIDGAIETPDIKEAVTETMEGGRHAFELRSRKYDFQ